MEKGKMTRLTRREAPSPSQLFSTPHAGCSPAAPHSITSHNSGHRSGRLPDRYLHPAPPQGDTTHCSRVCESGKKEGKESQPGWVGERRRGGGSAGRRPSAAAGGWRRGGLGGKGPAGTPRGQRPPPGPAHSPPGSDQSPAGGDPSCPPRGPASERACPLGAQLPRPPGSTSSPPPPQSLFRRLGFCRRGRLAGPLHFLSLPRLQRRAPRRSPIGAGAPGSRARYWACSARTRMLSGSAGVPSAARLRRCP